MVELSRDLFGSENPRLQNCRAIRQFCNLASQLWSCSCGVGNSSDPCDTSAGHVWAETCQPALSGRAELHGETVESAAASGVAQLAGPSHGASSGEGGEHAGKAGKDHGNAYPGRHCSVAPVSTPAGLPPRTCRAEPFPKAPAAPAVPPVDEARDAPSRWVGARSTTTRAPLVQYCANPHVWPLRGPARGDPADAARRPAPAPPERARFRNCSALAMRSPLSGLTRPCGSQKTGAAARRCRRAASAGAAGCGCATGTASGVSEERGGRGAPGDWVG